MPSTYSNLGIELIASGDQAGTWGTTTNTNLGTLIDQAIGGYTTVACTTGADTTITIPAGATGVARNMTIQLSGSGGASTNLIVPTNTKLYFIYNNASGAVTVKVSGQTGVSVPAAAKMVLVCNGTDVLTAQNYLASLTLGAALPVASGGSGVTSATAYAVLCGGTTSTNPIQAIASVGTARQVLTSNGAGFLPTMQTIAYFVRGMIIMWVGSVISIPDGWVICNGANDTPDLQNRFVIGAGNLYAVGDTGGSADATLPSHTHTATVTDPGHAHTSAAGPGPGSTNLDPISATTQQLASVGVTTGATTTGITVANSTAGVSGINANLSPYYALCYIMKT